MTTRTISDNRECIRCRKEKAPAKFFSSIPICMECTPPLTVKSIKDYQTCALLYNYRHIENSYEPLGKRTLLDVRFENTLKKIASFFFYKRQAGITPSWSALLNRWERLWFPKDMTAWDIMTDAQDPMHGNVAGYSADATAALLKFHEFFSADNSDALLIDEPFLVQLSSSGMRLEGAFDLVLRSAKTKEYQVIKWLTRGQKTQASDLLMDFAALKYAFDHRNSGRDIKRVTYGSYDLTASAKSTIKVYDIEDTDVNALKYWAREAWEAEVFVPRRGLTSYCRSCPFDIPCSKFVITDEMVQ